MIMSVALDDSWSTLGPLLTRFSLTWFPLTHFCHLAQKGSGGNSRYFSLVEVVSQAFKVLLSLKVHTF